MLTYRRCSPKDEKLWIQLNREFMSYEIEDDELWNGTGNTEDERFSITFKTALKSPELIDMLIFEEKGEPIGFANLMLIFSVWAHGKALVLDDLFIREHFRGKGYGRKIMKFIEQIAEEKECKRIQFQSEGTNSGAKEFYEAVGYTPVSMYFYVKYFNQ